MNRTAASSEFTEELLLSPWPAGRSRLAALWVSFTMHGFDAATRLPAPGRRSPCPLRIGTSSSAYPRGCAPRRTGAEIEGFLFLPSRVHRGTC